MSSAVGAAVALLAIGCASGAPQYLGRELGALSELHHAVRGRVFAVDSRTLYLHDFHYDGEGPAAYFYVGTSKTPSASGATRLRDERGSGSPLRRYRGESVTLSLPEGKTLRDIAWFSVWCDEYSINFGSVDIPRSLEYPKPAKVGALRGVHGVSSDPIVVVDAQTLLVPNFSYDGEAPDAKFWVGRGDKPSPQGIRIPDENGKESPLRKYDRKTIVLTLPGELTVFDIGHFAVWCEAFTVNFGHVTLPRAALANVPPSLKMLGVSPQSRNKALVGETKHAPSRSRKPLVRLDATTYRPPHLRAGPPAAPERPTAHAQHRRADHYTLPLHQLLTEPQSKHYEIQRSKEIERHHDQQTPETIGAQNEPNYQQDQQLEQERYLNQQEAERQPYNPGTQGHVQIEPQTQQNQQLGQYVNHHLIHLNEYYQPQSGLQQQQVLDLQNQQQSQVPSTQDLLYQQQFFEQQRRALEQELQQYRPQFQPEPLQYRLLPYNNEQHPESRRSYRQIDLDLVGSSGSN